MNNTISLRSIFLIFLRLGALTFGGGLAMLPIIKKDIVGRGWIDEDTFDDYIVIAQIAPGMIAINIATLTGKHLRRTIGSLVAVVGVATPSIIIISIIAATLSNFSEFEVVQNAIKGILLVVIVLLGTAIYDIGKRNIKNIFLLVYAIASMLTIIFLGISTTLIIAISILFAIGHTLLLRYRNND